MAAVFREPAVGRAPLSEPTFARDRGQAHRRCSIRGAVARSIMPSIGWACPVVLVIACASPPAEEARPPSTPPAAKSARIPTEAPAPSDDTAARIARVERGLVPEVRVKGEKGGWSIEERLRVHHTPGVSVAVIHDHRVVWAKAYGVADAATGARLTDTTLMQAASVSKTFTALAALKEVEAGRIPLEANVNRTLRSWRLPENEWTRATPVTLKHLLSHTGGTNVPSIPEDGRSPTLLEILEGKPPAMTPPVRVELAPGTKFRYSGGATTVVQQMLVDVRGRPFPELMEDVVFAPLKLSHSTFAQPVKSERWPSVAAGHDFDATVLGGTFRVWTGAAAGGLWSTPTDIARLLIEVQLGLRGRSTVVSKEIASRMTTPVISTGDGDVIATTLGAFVEKHGTGVYFGHDGHGIGFMTISRASTTDGKGAVVMANGQASTPLMLEILRSIAAEYAWDGWLMPPIDVARVDAAHLAALAGRYGADDRESMLVAVKDDRLEVRQPFREPLELLPVAADVFLARADGTRFTFATSATGARSLVRAPPPWPPAGGAVTLQRLPDGAPPEPLELLESGRIDDALSLSKRLRKANPKDPRVQESHLGSIGEDLTYRLLDAKRAVPVLQLNMALHPQSPMACVNLAEALLRAGRRAEAVPLYTKAKSLFARDATMGEFPRVYFRWKLARLKALDAAAK
jgi:CubicO group peptidase (beta-lactamase class C family)